MLIKWLYKILNLVFNNKCLFILSWLLTFAYIFLFIKKNRIYHYNTIGIHTNLFFYFFIFLFIFTLKHFHLINKKIFSKVKYITSILLTIEILLIVVQPQNIIIPYTYFQYSAIYNTKFHNHFHTSPPNSEYVFSQKSEFHYDRAANSLGFSDSEWTKDKKVGTIRIICLGDSFTEGDGAHVDSNYVSFLRRSLQIKNHNIEVFNAGKRGSDPFFNFESLKKLLIDYQPDIVIQSFTTNDFYNDFLIFGGKERFVNDSTLQFRKNYWWEPIYASSYISRILIQSFGGYDKYFIKKKEYPIIYKDLEKQTVELFQEYKEFSKEHNFELITFNFPFKNNTNKDYEEFQSKFTPLFSGIGLEFNDLNDCYEQYSTSNHNEREYYYWKNDGHHNAQGYEMMAHCVEEIVLPILEKNKGNKNSLLN